MLFSAVLDSGSAASLVASAPISRKKNDSSKYRVLTYAIQTAPSTTGNNYRIGKTTQQGRKCRGKCERMHIAYVCSQKKKNTKLERIQSL